MSNVERRISSIEFEIRSSKSGGKSIEGFAATYGKLSSPIPAGSLGGVYRERIQRGAFASAVSNKQDVVMLINHDPSLILGRTASGTLALTDTPKGLKFHCDLPNTNSASELHESVQRGDINGCSFSFVLGTRDAKFEEEEDEDEDDKELGLRRSVSPRKKILVRTISNVSKLIDVSVVTHPAYNGTSVNARSREFSIVKPVITMSPAEIQQNIDRLAAEIEQDSPRARRRDLLRQILSN
jgi:HK97 family phage prohead protease